MTLGAKLFRRKEMVKSALVGFHFAVALSAFDLLHVNMFGMEKRFVDPLSLPLRVALIAILLAHDHLALVPFGNSRRPMQYEADQELVLFRDSQMMAVMTVQGLMFALRPTIISRLHQVTAHAELWIILREIVKLICDKTSAEYNDENKGTDEQLCSQRDRLLETIRELRDLSFKPINQFHFPPVGTAKKLKL
jgi:hypothetical protein